MDDIARGTIAALRPLGYEVINLGSDRPVVLLEVLRLIERLVGERARIDYQPFHKADIHATWADITAARQKLGWEPGVHHEQGVEKLVQWYRDNREWARDISTA